MDDPTWGDANRRHLAASLAVVREAGAAAEADAIAAAMATPPALALLTQVYDLSPFERDVVLLCAGVELDPALAADPPPTFTAAMTLLDGADWSALAPTSPLRRVPLVEVGAGAVLAAAPLRIEERVMHFLLGVATLDQRLAPLVTAVIAADDPTAAVAEAAATLAAIWVEASDRGRWAPVQVYGGDRAGRRAAFAAACDEVGLRPYAVRAADLPAAAHERDVLCRLWDRETVLAPVALVIELDDGDGPEVVRTALAVADRNPGVLTLASRDPVRTALVRVEVRAPTAAERAAGWHTAAGQAGLAPDLALDRLSAQFDLAPPAMRAAIRAASAGGAGPGDLDARLWRACRDQARPRLDDLAQRITPRAGWDDLVLPDPTVELLHELASHVRHRAQVYERWGFARKSERGLGISALFAGASGTGKTMSSEVLAGELDLDLYRIDLSQVVSKYIGETEKNLRRVFDAAEEGGAILLFDEADALFGKRSEVKDSHDRYANIEVGYLLQRMESYRGLAILTTNMRDALDTSFQRRLRFVIEFPFPDLEQREAMWARAFPRETPTDGLEPASLARWTLAGGSIRNIAMNAAFLAAAAGEPVRYRHVLHAARGEYAKIGRPDTELRDAP